jgi:hypothetical protein
MAVLKQFNINIILRELIGEWRRYWYEKSYGKTDEKFPFGFVQLAAFSDQRDHYTWPKLRYHQTSGFSYVPNDSMENTFMAVAMDTNDPAFDSLHPPHKVCIRFSNCYIFFWEVYR